LDEIKTHKDLKVYQKGINLVTDIYKFTASFPEEEKFGLISQLRRAAVSVPTNISEGSSRKSTKEFIHFLYISLGSASEIETLLEISKNLGFDRGDENDSLVADLVSIKRMILSLIKSLKENI
jgi:four helix bundle protein